MKVNTVLRHQDRVVFCAVLFEANLYAKAFAMDTFGDEKLKAGWVSSIEGHERGHRSRWTTYLYHPREKSLRIVHGLYGNPAMRLTDLRTGVVMREEWRINGMHREDGPALIVRDVKTGVVVRREWFLHGRHHRTDGPAIVRYDRVTGAVIYEADCIKGKICSERRYPENELNATPRELAARSRWERYRKLKRSPDPS